MRRLIAVRPVATTSRWPQRQQRLRHEQPRVWIHRQIEWPLMCERSRVDIRCVPQSLRPTMASVMEKRISPIAN